MPEKKFSTKSFAALDSNTPYNDKYSKNIRWARFHETEK